jgi:hypothetical protein
MIANTAVAAILLADVTANVADVRPSYIRFICIIEIAKKGMVVNADGPVDETSCDQQILIPALHALGRHNLVPLIERPGIRVEGNLIGGAWKDSLLPFRSYYQPVERQPASFSILLSAGQARVSRGEGRPGSHQIPPGQ